jgi:hypothetical protein
MKKGILIYAHNDKSMDYALMATISGGLAKKHLNVPVSLVTDEHTISYMEKSKMMFKAKKVFERFIIVEKPLENNKRLLHDGSSEEVIPFLNTNRWSAWEITPYERTLLIDSDYLIFSSRLAEYWDVDTDIMIGESIKDVYSERRLGYLDRYISETGIKLYWATTLMFTKNEQTKLFFSLVKYIKDNYSYFSDIYRFDNRVYRNDIAFSVAKHILNGFETLNCNDLPPILSALDRDMLIDVENNRLKFLIDHNLNGNYCAASMKEIDIHVMNKQSIVRNKDKLLGLI